MSQCFCCTIFKVSRSILWGRFIHPRIREDGTRYRFAVNSSSDSYLPGNRGKRYVLNTERGVRVGMEELNREKFSVILRGK